MKLKKIASLMLAGVMAVSMLAGCSDNGGSSSSEPTTPVTPVNGVAATVNGELDENADKVSFTDNQVVTEMMTNYFEENPVAITTVAGSASQVTACNGWYPVLYTSIQNVLGAHGSGLGTGFSSTGTNEGTYFDIYVLSSEYLTMNDALRMVGKHIDALTLPAEGDTTNPSDNVNDTDFSYTGSVAAIEAETKGGTESVWVVAVAITQTGADK